MGAPDLSEDAKQTSKQIETKIAAGKYFLSKNNESELGKNIEPRKNKEGLVYLLLALHFPGYANQRAPYIQEKRKPGK